ncbi:hypothetical protein [Rhodopirellula sp. P2]|uniref:hypothetical protein n=1 Tax=Rhodopirellula sp. P2 TaxID=2127060 RepID=UPI002367A8AC|nr:hypothetical protein [Rhodopirellula sp. P2]WDQ16383.1 hypothetical protein PSR62_22570 [Rhodopirellula sp. P2]
MKTTKTTVHFRIDGRAICYKHYSAHEFVSFGDYTGSVGNVQCFASLTVKAPSGRERTTTTDYVGKPVSVCLKRPGQPDAWFGLASRDDVIQANADRALAGAE